MKQRKKLGFQIDPEFEDFASFLKHVGPRPSDEHTLDRINNGNPTYAPGLVAWADKKTQANNRSSTIMLSYQGKTDPLTYWAEASDQRADTLRKRKRAGWLDHEIITGCRDSVEKNDHPIFRVEPMPWKGEMEEQVYLEGWFQQNRMNYSNRYEAYIDWCNRRLYWSYLLPPEKVGEVDPDQDLFEYQQTLLLGLESDPKATKEHQETVVRYQLVLVEIRQEYHDWKQWYRRRENKLIHEKTERAILKARK